MEKDKTKNQGPSCACGKEELFVPLYKTKKEKLSSIKKENKDKTSIDTKNQSK